MLTFSAIRRQLNCIVRWMRPQTTFLWAFCFKCLNNKFSTFLFHLGFVDFHYYSMSKEVDLESNIYTTLCMNNLLCHKELKPGTYMGSHKH